MYLTCLWVQSLHGDRERNHVLEQKAKLYDTLVHTGGRGSGSGNDVHEEGDRDNEYQVDFSKMKNTTTTAPQYQDGRDGGWWEGTYKRAAVPSRNEEEGIIMEDARDEKIAIVEEIERQTKRERELARRRRETAAQEEEKKRAALKAEYLKRKVASLLLHKK